MLQNLCTYRQNWPIKHKADSNGTEYDNCHDMKANQVGVLFCVSRTGLWGYHLCLTNWHIGTWRHLPTLTIQLSWQWTGQSWQRQWVLFSSFIFSTMTETNRTSVGSWNHGCWWLLIFCFFTDPRASRRLKRYTTPLCCRLVYHLSLLALIYDVQFSLLAAPVYENTSPVLLWRSHTWNM